jgi:hypothetical protein
MGITGGMCPVQENLARNIGAYLMKVKEITYLPRSYGDAPSVGEEDVHEEPEADLHDCQCDYGVAVQPVGF